jgi:hypothetical protein
VKELADLWAGRLPLDAAFWKHAVLFGLAANMAATAASLGAVTAGLSPVLALALHLTPLPYVVACATGVWRSAGRQSGSQFWAQAAQASVLVWSALLVLV